MVGNCIVLLKTETFTQVIKIPFTDIEISVSPEARDLLFLEWACRISENFNGMGPDFKEMVVRACLRFAVISYTTIQTIYTIKTF
jgi:hypothetical protein